MRRRLFLLASLLSLLLFLAVAVGGIVSANVHRTWSVSWTNPVSSTKYRLSLERGTLDFWRYWDTRAVPFGADTGSDEWGDGWDGIGIHYHASITSASVNGKRLAGNFGKSDELWCSMYVPAVLTAVLPVVWLVREVTTEGPRRRRLARGRCGYCKYDLTGNTSGVCPECGTAVVGKVGA